MRKDKSSVKRWGCYIVFGMYTVADSDASSPFPLLLLKTKGWFWVVTTHQLFMATRRQKDPMSGAKCQNISLIPMLKWSPMKSQPSNLLICCRLNQTCASWLFQKTLPLLEGGNCFKLIHRWQFIELWQLKEVYNYITIYAAMELLETHLYHLFQCRQPPSFIPSSTISFCHHITWSQYSGYHCWTKQ